MAEIEISAISKQCLDRRIGSIEVLSDEVSAWAESRNCQKATIFWEFTKNDARSKFGRFYQSIKN
jgi:hypothetical protein